LRLIEPGANLGANLSQSSEALLLCQKPKAFPYDFTGGLIPTLREL
jgi:hypothetical protein